MKGCGAKFERHAFPFVLMVILASGTVRADPFDDLNNTEIPRDISSNSRIERIQVWGERIPQPSAPAINPLDFVNISVSIIPPREGGICLNCNTAHQEEEDNHDDNPSIIEDLKQGAKIIWSVVSRSKGGAIRFMFQSAPLGDYCSDKPQDIACQRNVRHPESIEKQNDFSVERYDLMHVIPEAKDIERATLFGYPVNAVASAIFDQPVKPDGIRFDSYFQDDATGKLVLTFTVDPSSTGNAMRTPISRAPAPPIRIDREGRVFVEP